MNEPSLADWKPGGENPMREMLMRLLIVDIRESILRDPDEAVAKCDSYLESLPVSRS